MAIDSRDKRASALLWLLRIGPTPDLSLSAGDRQHVAGFYRGISAGAPIVITLSVERAVAVDYENRIFAVSAEDRIVDVAYERRTREITE